MKIKEKAFWHSYSGGFNILDMIDETLAMEAGECLVEDIFEPATAAAYYEGMIIRMGKEISVTLDDETAISIPC